MNVKKQLNEYEFVRTIHTVGKNGQKSSFVAQPYLTSGMYVALTLPGGSFHQMAVPHKTYAKWVNDSIKMQEKNGSKTTITKAKYVDFHSEKEFEEWILPKLITSKKKTNEK